MERWRPYCTVQNALELTPHFGGDSDLAQINIIALQEIVCEAGVQFYGNENHGWNLVFRKTARIQAIVGVGLALHTTPPLCIIRLRICFFVGSQ